MELSKVLSALNLFTAKLGVSEVISSPQASAYCIRIGWNQVDIQGNYTEEFARTIASSFPDAAFKLSGIGYWETNIVFNEVSFLIILT